MPTTGTMRYLKIGDATYEVYDTNDDTKVYQSYKAASGYTYWRPLVIGYSSGSTETFTPADQTNLTYTFDTLKVQPSSGTIRFGAAALVNGSYTNTISADTLTANRTLTAPNKSGTIALTSDISTAIAELPTPMLFKGSVGTGGTITSLPAAAAANEGFTYKVITALSSPVSAKVGDTVISNGSEWVVIPSGDEPSGTVTSVGLSNATNGGLTISGSPITSSGSITVGHSNVLTSAQTTEAVYPIKIDKNGHISSYGSAVTIPDVSGKIDTAGVGLDKSGTTLKVKLNSETAITDTSKVYNVGVNSSGELCVKVSWSDIQTRTSDSGTERTIYLAGGTTSGDETDGLSKHESIKALVSSNTETDGYTVLALGNSTSVGSAGAKYGCLRLYGKYNTFIDIRPQSSTSTGTIYLPSIGGTLVLEEDLLPVAQQSPDLNVALVSSSSKSKFYDSHGGLTYTSLYFSDGSQGFSGLTLGNNIAIGTELNARGYIRLYGNSTYYTDIAAPNSTATRTITLPDKTGTVALTSDIPDVSGKIDTAGTGLSKSGTTLNHSNSVTAQTTQAVYPIKIDAQGHISAYGSAVTIPTIPSNNVTGSGSTNYLAEWSGTNTLSKTSLYTSTSYNTQSDLYGTIRLYIGDTGQVDWRGQLVFHDGSSSKTITITPPSLTASRTITLPDKTGTIALTDDIPDVSSFITDAGVTKITTTAGTHTAITNSTGAVSFNVPTKTSHLTNDSGFVTSSGITGSGTTNKVPKFTSASAIGDGYGVTDNSSSTAVTSTDTNLITGRTLYYAGYTKNSGTVTLVTAGTGLAIGSTAQGNFTTTGTINHTNSVTAQTTQAVYPIKIDAQGHISAYGTAVTSMPASDVSSWAKASTKPSYTASEVGALPAPSAGSVSEMGQYIDFHATGGAADYDVRLSASAGTSTGGGFLHINGKALKDFIVAQGTSGNWYYRKWNSGRYELWYDSGSTTITCSTSGGNGWYRNSSEYTINMPTGLGISTVKHAEITVNTDYAYVVSSVVHANSTKLGYYVSHLGSLTSATAYISAYVFGSYT